MSVPGSIGTTKAMSKEAQSGHMNDDYTFAAGVTQVTEAGDVNRGMSDIATKRGIMAPVVIQDISAEQHGSWANDVMTPNEVHGFPFKVHEDN